MKRVVRRYNKIMNSLCLEYLTIGTKLSENTHGWNVRDMVAECDYQYHTYIESGHNNYDLKTSNYRKWLSEKKKLQRFIARYQPLAMKEVCKDIHNSCFDNKVDKKALF